MATSLSNQNNIMNDGSAEIAAIMEVLHAIENAHKIIDANGLAALRVLKHYVLNGEGSLLCNSIPAKYAKEFEDEMKDAHIPFIAFPTADGGISYICRDCDEDKFMELQRNVLSQDTQYAKETTVEYLLDYANRRDKDIAYMSFDTKEERDAFFNKAYNDGYGFVPAEEFRDGKYYVYTAHEALFNEGIKTDIATAILEMNADNAGPEARMKDAQLKAERFQMERIMERMRSGEEFALVDAYRQHGKYALIKDNTIAVYAYNKETDTYEQEKKAIKLPNWKDEAEVRAFEITAAHMFAKVKNMKEVELYNVKSHLGKSQDELNAERKAYENKAFRAVYLRPEGESLEDALRKLEVRPQFSNIQYEQEFLKEAEEKRADAAKRGVDYSSEAMGVENALAREQKKLQTLQEKFDAYDTEISGYSAQIKELQNKLLLADSLSVRESIQYQIDDLNQIITSVTKNVEATKQSIVASNDKLCELSAELDRIAALQERCDEEEAYYKGLTDSIKDTANGKKIKDEAIRSVSERAHREVKMDPEYASMPYRQKEKKLEEVMLRILYNVETPELRAYKENLEGRHIKGEYERLCDDTKDAFENKLHSSTGMKEYEDFKDRENQKRKEAEAERKHQEKEEPDKGVKRGDDE